MEISIARALTELKTLDSRIEKAIYNSVLVGAKRKSSQKINNKYTKEEFIELTKADNQSVKDLIERKKLIKQAVVRANAETRVVVAGTDYTIADAIERKRSIELDKELLETMKTQYRKALSEVERNNDKVERELKELLDTRMSSDSKDSKNSNNNNLEFATSYRDMNEWELIDPLGLEKAIQQLEFEIDEFEMDVDSSLSEINAITKIVIPD